MPAAFGELVDRGGPAQLVELYALRTTIPDASQAGEVTLGARFDSSVPQVVDVALFEGEDVFGYWSSDPATQIPPPLPPEPVLYAPPALLADSCALAADFEFFGAVRYSAFESEAAAREGITGTWARCTDYASSEHVALQIHEDGSWNHVVLEGGKLVERRGFGHEGHLWLSDAEGRKNQMFGKFKVGMYPFDRLGC